MPAAQPAATAKAKTSGRSPWRPWLLWAVAIATLAAIGSIKIPNYVTGEATIAARVNARDRLTMPRAGMIRIRVERNSEVALGDVIAEIDSPELAQQIAAAELGLEQAAGGLQAAEQNLVLAQTRWNASQQETAIARGRARDRQTDLRALSSGSGLPRSRQIQQEQAALEQEIRALHSQIASGQSEIAAAANEMTELIRQLDHKRQVYDERYKLVDREVLSANHPMVEGLRTEILDLERRIQAAKDRQQTQQHGIAETHQ
ncbi:MAG: biotin/lipoyl-binding protein [Spirulinaceae cyanobacterium RM2_2_10]|nr:biotin/lipoyl-binding protein [Spirulinaceae cyanobacterium RM2_2_10]